MVVELFKVYGFIEMVRFKIFFNVCIDNIINYL